MILLILIILLLQSEAKEEDGLGWETNAKKEDAAVEVVVSRGLGEDEVPMP